MPFCPLASSVASEDLGVLVFGKGNFLPVGPQGPLIAVTPSLPHTRRWRGFCLVCVCRGPPMTSVGLAILDILLGLHIQYLEMGK